MQRWLAISLASIMAGLLLMIPAWANEIQIEIRAAETGLLRAPDIEGEVVRNAIQGESFIAVTTVGNFYLVKDEETGSFLYIAFPAAVELCELPEQVLVSGQMPMPERQDLSYWQIAPSDKTEGGKMIQLRSSSQGGMLVAHNGKKYPASYEYNTDYQPQIDGTQLASDARAYLGVSYVLGGESLSGIDCSGLTRVCLGNQGVDVVHRASLQALEGRYVPQDSLKVGDLIFFCDPKTPRYLSHVGIYLGGNRFIHASQSRGGVLITSLSDKYFKSHYAFARRL